MDVHINQFNKLANSDNKPEMLKVSVHAQQDLQLPTTEMAAKRVRHLQQPTDDATHS